MVSDCCTLLTFPYVHSQTILKPLESVFEPLPSLENDHLFISIPNRIYLLLEYDELHVHDAIDAYRESPFSLFDVHSPISLWPFFVVEYENTVLRSHTQALLQWFPLEFAFEEREVGGIDLSMNKKGCRMNYRIV